MYLSPLSIYYTSSVNGSDDLIAEIDLERKIKSYKDNRTIPKLQVFYKDGHHFTLNNSELRVCRRLQNDGFCHRIRVEKVPVKCVPKGILEMMVIPEQHVQFKRDVGKRSKTGYRQLSCSNYSTDQNETKDDTDDNDSLSSCSIDSSSDEVSKNDKQDELDSDDWVSSSDESTGSEVAEEEESFL